MNIVRICFVFFIFALSACDQINQNDGQAGTQGENGNFKLLSNTNNFKISNYNEARAVFWKYVYPSSAKTLYCNEVFNSKERSGFNIEHVFPMSWATNGLSCGTRKQCRNNSPTFNKIEADLHNLYPSRSDVNEKRSSFRFGLIRGEERHFGQACDFEFDSRRRIVEPAESVRGDVARAMFYMASQYKQHGLVLFKNQVVLLRGWHQSDPPTNAEKSRNALIEQIQGNRNPFIDEPDKLIELIEQGHFKN